MDEESGISFRGLTIFMEPDLLNSIREVFDEQCQTRRIITEDGHWLWSGSINHKGYGKTTITVKKKAYFFQVHRLSLILAGRLGPESSKLALHRTICSFKNCFNPEHLKAGTTSDNTYDSVTTNTHKESRKTHCPQGHEYTKENTYSYNGGRMCKICTNTRAINCYNKNKIKDLNEED